MAMLQDQSIHLMLPGRATLLKSTAPLLPFMSSQYGTTSKKITVYSSWSIRESSSQIVCELSKS